MENEIKLKQLLISILRHGGNYVRNYPTVAIENALQEQGLRFTGNDIEPYDAEEEMKGIDVDVNSIIQECQVNNDDTPENLHSYLYGEGEELTAFDEEVCACSNLNLSLNQIKEIKNESKILYNKAKEEVLDKVIDWLNETFYVRDYSSGRGEYYEIHANFDTVEELIDDLKETIG